MAINWMGLVTTLAVTVAILLGFFVVTCRFKSKPREDIDLWQQWKQWLSNRRTPPGHGWWQLYSLDGAVEPEHVIRTVNGTTHATTDDAGDDAADDTADDTADDSADDTLVGTATGAASRTITGTSDTPADATANITANGAANGPH